MRHTVARVGVPVPRVHGHKEQLLAVGARRQRVGRVATREDDGDRTLAEGRAVSQAADALPSRPPRGMARSRAHLGRTSGASRLSLGAWHSFGNHEKSMAATWRRLRSESTSA